MGMPQNEDEWKQAITDVTNAMCVEVSPFTTPLSKILSATEGELLGTASYMAVLGQTLLITNDHNLVNIQKTGIGAQFYGNDQPYRVPRALSSPFPFDVGVSGIPDTFWNDPKLKSASGRAYSSGPFCARPCAS